MVTTVKNSNSGRRDYRAESYRNILSKTKGKAPSKAGGGSNREVNKDREISTIQRNTVTGEIAAPVASTSRNYTPAPPKATSVYQPVATSATQVAPGGSAVYAIVEKPSRGNNNGSGRIRGASNSEDTGNRPPDFGSNKTGGNNKGSVRQGQIRNASEQSVLQRIGTQAQTSRINAEPKSPQQAGYFLLGVGANFPGAIKQTVFDYANVLNPKPSKNTVVQTSKAVSGAAVESYSEKDPTIFFERLLFQPARENPERFTAKLTSDLGTGYGLGKVPRGFQEVRFLGKTEIPAGDIVAESFLKGDEFYPTSPSPSFTVKTARDQGYVFQASPTRLGKGGVEVESLTQVQKMDLGLPLSETGGIYVAPRVSPGFTRLVSRSTDETPVGLSLLPKVGEPGSIQMIYSDAARIPRSVRSKGYNAANKYLDTKAAFERPGTSFSTPATEILGKTESELIVPGGSTLFRTKEYGAFSRFLGTDFDKFVRIPTEFGGKQTRRVAIREYRNIGAKGDFDNFFGGSRRVRASDVDYYSAPKPSRAGFLRLSYFAPRSSSRSSKSSRKSPPVSSSGLPSSVVKQLYGSASPKGFGSGVPSGIPSRVSDVFRSAPGSGVSGSPSKFNPSVPSFPVPKLAKEFDFDFKLRLEEKATKRKSRAVDINEYQASFAARALGLKGKGKKNAKGFTGRELRGL